MRQLLKRCVYRTEGRNDVALHVWRVLRRVLSLGARHEFGCAAWIGCAVELERGKHLGGR